MDFSQLNSERMAHGHEPDASKGYTVLHSPNEQVFATTTWNELEVKLLDASTHSQIDTLFLDKEQAGRWGRYLAFYTDSTLIACRCHNMIRIWNWTSRPREINRQVHYS
jgi:hypothetical protein